MEEFTEFPKIARMSRSCVVSEKIDGMNSLICITEDSQFLVGSRTRWITPDDDNHGFAKWAHDHEEELRELGKGRHFGEWFGSGIGRAYGLKEKRFSLFNTIRWCLHDQEPQRIETADPRIEKYQEKLPPCYGLVPVLYKGIFTTQAVEDCVEFLRKNGSQAVPGFMRPEGVVVFHIAGNVGFKKTLEKDEEPKSKK